MKWALSEIDKKGPRAREEVSKLFLLLGTFEATLAAAAFVAGIVFQSGNCIYICTQLCALHLQLVET